MRGIQVRYTFLTNLKISRIAFFERERSFINGICLKNYRLKALKNQKQKRQKILETLELFHKLIISNMGPNFRLIK